MTIDRRRPQRLHAPDAGRRSQTTLLPRGAELFVNNLSRWERGEPLVNVVDLHLGY